MDRRLPHIDALKGIAILLVLLYHLDRTAFCTGYLGVDIFFAVSGYFLLKDYVAGGAGEGKSPGAFLRRRGIRLFAPLIPMLVVTLALSAMLCHYQNTLLTAETGLCSLLGVANAYLSHCVGDYFSAEAMHNPLVHLWYLSVYMQALLLFRLLALLTRGVLRGVRARRALLVLVAAVSFLAGHCAWGDGEPVGYYATFPRLWEFALGGLAAALPCATHRNGAVAASAAGGFVLLSLVPGIWGGCADLAVVAATCIIIRAGEAVCTFTGVVCGMFRHMGRASYSIYLWHLPLIFFFKYLVEKQPYSWDRLSLVPLSLLLGYSMYRLVERRQWHGPCILSCHVLTLLLFAAAVGTHGGAGYLHRQAYRQVAVSDAYERTACRDEHLLRDFPAADLHNWREVAFAHDSLWKVLVKGGGAESDLYTLGDTAGPPEFLLMGDSHAGSISYGFDSVGREMGWRGVYLGPYVVPLWADCEHEYSRRQSVPYAQSRNALLQWLKAHPELHTIVVAQNWTLRMEYAPHTFQVPPERLRQSLHDAIVEYFRRLSETGRRIIILDDVPHFPAFSVSGVYRCLILGKPLQPAQIEKAKDEYERETEFFNGLFEELLAKGYCCAVVHQAPPLEEGGCYKAIINHQILMKDNNHLNSTGADRVVRACKDSLDALLREGREKGGSR